MNPTTSPLLSAEDLIQLTGYRRPSFQRRWLDAQGIRYYVRADGYPAVPTDALYPKAHQATQQPNWSAL